MRFNDVRKLIFFFLQAIYALASCAQVIPATRRVDWSVAGLSGPVPAYSASVSITAFGGIGDGVTNNTVALQNAMASLGGASGTVCFPNGVFKFTSSVAMPDSIIIRGGASDSTTLLFDLGGALNDCFTIHGSQTTQLYSFSASAWKDSNIVQVSQAAGLLPGDYLRIYQNDSILVTSSWAYRTVGQIVEIASVNGSSITLTHPLRKDYLLGDSCRAVKIIPAKAVGFECFKLKRADATSQQTTNLDFDKAVNCWVRGIESDSCNYAHIALSYCSNITISESYFHHALAYGGNGQGYGIATQFTSGECLIVNNIFQHLRHSMLLQAGANGNVYAYNYSFDPFWTQPPFPSGASGDIVLHGNYPYYNLFEGNIVQNIVIDDSHGKNGPYNTFFRNRGEFYGLVMNNNPPSDNQNFVGNEITNNSQGLYLLSGSGHFEFGNNDKGNITPSGTNSLPDSSYYLSANPPFFSGSLPWPSIGIPNALNNGTIPAKVSKQNGQLTSCSSPIANNGIITYQEEVRLFPNPASEQLVIESDPGTAELCDLTGQILASFPVGGKIVLDLSTLSKGMYLIRLTTTAGVHVEKLIVGR